ncbi:MAG: hypothetical protein LBV49_11240 [Azonexus sp.]|jgi:hypothetical protein|nr:hypothetical protein [Azonexus sp.]
MKNLTESAPSPAADADIQGILEWLAVGHDHSGSNDAEQLYGQLFKLRNTPLPLPHRIKLLDLLCGHVERIVKTELQGFQSVSLPVGRRVRQRIKRVIRLLAALTQDYFNSLAKLLDSDGGNSLHSPQNSLLRAMQGIIWQIKISHLLAAPTGTGLWQQLHAAFRTARRLSLETFPGPRGGPGIQRAYTNILLAAVAHPASFSAAELTFISSYIEGSPLPVELSTMPPASDDGVFWIDPERDFPAHALIRRIPAPRSQPLYFSCAAVAAEIYRQLGELEAGASAASLNLPAFAETRSGQGVLRRLAELWGNPAKRRFVRRRQFSRVNLCLGLDNLWRLMRHNDPLPQLSEWMVLNESPEGYALMHVKGSTEGLHIGDVVAVQVIDEQDENPKPWCICLVRWAVSENPEHIELGLQLIASRAIAAEISQPDNLDAHRVTALVLPETLPLRPFESLLVASGKIGNGNTPLVLLIEKDNLLIREIHAGKLTEQTSNIELFNVTRSGSTPGAVQPGSEQAAE